MRPFMVTAGIRQDNPLGLMALLPHHRVRIDALIREGQLLSYTVSADRKTLWMTLLAKNEAEVLDLLASLPLASYLNPDIQPALFFDSQAVRLPQLSLN